MKNDNCKIIIKIQDYFPKIDTISYENYICLFTYRDYEGQIPFLPDDSEILQHRVKNVWVIWYQIKGQVLDYNDKPLIGMCQMNFSCDMINKIFPPNGLVQKQQKKLLIDLKTKRKFFCTLVNIGDIFLSINLL